MPATTQQKPRAAANTTVISSWADVLATVAETRLLESSYVELRGVSCEFHEGVITLRGRVPQWYLKQVAQNLVRRLEGVVEVDNRLNVGPPPSWPATGRPVPTGRSLPTHPTQGWPTISGAADVRDGLQLTGSVSIA